MSATVFLISKIRGIIYGKMGHSGSPGQRNLPNQEQPDGTWHSNNFVTSAWGVDIYDEG